MESWDIEKTASVRLSRLMGDEPAAPEWSEKDLEAILRHQLSVPLERDLGREFVSLDSRLSDLSYPEQFRGLSRMTFGELLLHPRPPEEALQLVKRFAKARKSDPIPLLPGEVATAIYYAAVVAAELRLNRSISTLRREELRAGVQWAISQGWIVDPLRSLFVEASRAL